MPGWRGAAARSRPDVRRRRRFPGAARLADLLRLAGVVDDTRLVTVVVAWMSGELPQRQIGVGWAALRPLPDPAAEPSLRVRDVDATLSAIGTMSGKGSQALQADLFAAATDIEQTFLRRLLAGELRQGALIGVMVDAVSRPPKFPRRQYGGPRCSVANCLPSLQRP